MTYDFLQHYWWFVVSLLAALLVFLLFVQGGNSLLFAVGKTPLQRKMLVNSTGRKWEFTFTTLVTFGGAFFASFPLFYSTSFGGAYWLWMLILFSFVIQAVSYEYQSRSGNVWGTRTYQVFLVLNGVMGPLLLGVAVATFFTGSDFVVLHDNLTAGPVPVVSRWNNHWHGLEAVADGWNLTLGLAVFFLSRVLGALYFLNNIRNEVLHTRIRQLLPGYVFFFLVFFLAFLCHLLTTGGYAVNEVTGHVFVEPYKYLHNLLDMPGVTATWIAGVGLVLWGIGATLFRKTCTWGIWPAGAGTVLTVLALMLTAGYNHTAYYPSVADLQSSLTLANSCSSEYTLRTMAWVSLFVPLVLIYIFFAWRAIDSRKIDEQEMGGKEHTY